MENPKFIISNKKYKGSSTVVSVRLPRDMVADLDKTAEMTGRNRNDIIMKSLEFALNNLEIDSGR